MSPNDRPIALIGLMGAGKSTVARLLAARLGRSLCCLDGVLEREQGATIAGLFVARGEAAFRRLEHQALARAIEAGEGVIDCGGGVVLEADCRVLLRERCRTAWLEVAPATAAQRLAAAGDRPLLAGAAPEARLGDLLAERAGRYAGLAQLRVSTDGRTPDQVAAEIEAWARGGA